MKGKNSSVMKKAMFLAIAFLVLTGGLIGARVFVKTALIDGLQLNSAFLTRFVGDRSVQNAYQDTDAAGRMFPEVEHAASHVRKKVSDTVTAYFPLYTWLVEKFNRAERKLGFRLSSSDEYNSVAELSDGYLVNRSEREDESAVAEAVIMLSKRAEAFGVPVLYVGLPSKVCRTEDVGIDDMLNHDNENLDSLLSMLTAEGIRVLDLRNWIHETGYNHHSLFYRTDHHWRISASCMAGGAVAKELNERFGTAVDTSVFNLALYHEEIYENRFLGSLGKKLTLACCEPEDIAVYIPLFDAAYRIRVPAIGVDETGDGTVLYDFSHLEPGDYYEMSPYTCCIYGNNALTVIDNLKRPEAAKILFIGNSFDNSMSVFFAAGVGRLDVMDLRKQETEAAFFETYESLLADCDAVVVSGMEFDCLTGNAG